MNYANIKYYDIANGPGVRTSVFVSGCRHHCPGCFNAVAWDFDYGQPFDKTVRNEVFASCQPDYIAGLSLLGGEPFEPENQRELLPFVRNFKALYPAKTVWCYSGYTWEQLTGKEPSPARCEVTDELLALLDVLVDGRFVQAEHDISLRFRGSRNQRLLDVPKSLAAGQPVWWEDEKLLNALYAVRKRLAGKQNLPAFMVFNDATLREMAEKKPMSIDELVNISGVGEKKAARYGNAFLRVIEDAVGSRE